MLFFTTGTVGLLILVFIWSVLHYGLFSLDHLIHGLINFKLLGYSLPQYLNLPENNGIGRNVHLLKIIASCLVLAGSCFCVLVSYLPKVSWQLRATSFVLSLFLLSFLLFFWFRLIEGNQIIEQRQISTLFSITLILYLGGVFGLWYSLRAGGRARKINSATNKGPVSPIAKQAAKTSSNEELAAAEGNGSKIEENEEEHADAREEEGAPKENQSPAEELQEQGIEEPGSSSSEGADLKDVTLAEDEEEESNLEGEGDASQAADKILDGQEEADITSTDPSHEIAELPDGDATETPAEEANHSEHKV